MTGYEHYHDTVHWHMADITSRIIAKSGIPSDRYHLGKIILQCFTDYPDDVAQIEGTTGESENNSSLLKRSIQCAISLKKLGFQQGDVMILMAPNHLDLAVPFYAALYLGIIIAPIDRFLGINELVDSFTVVEPKIIFCQSEKVKHIRQAMTGLESKAKIITFDKGDGDIDFSELLEQGEDPKEVAQFCPTDFDPAETIAMLVATSGTTGLPKSAAATHKNFAIMEPYFWARTVEIPSFKRSLMVAPLQWLSAILNYMAGPFLRFTRVQSFQNMTQEHAYELINKYRPSSMIISPTMLMTLVRPGYREDCDFTCFERIYCGGSAVYTNLLEELEKVTPTTEVINVYGMSEVTCTSFSHGFSSPRESCGKPIGCLQYRLVDTETERDINEPNVCGELWLKGPGFFKGYYNNPEATKEVFVEGRWFKTGDLFYRDANWNFYFVERIKLLLKYRNHQISPVEVETVIRRHPGVLDVVVTGIPDPECGELLVAVVVPKPGQTPTAQEIKDLVKGRMMCNEDEINENRLTELLRSVDGMRRVTEKWNYMRETLAQQCEKSLTDTKQLRGGVIFLEQLPLTASTKVHQRKIREMALTMKRE